MMGTKEGWAGFREGGMGGERVSAGLGRAWDAFVNFGGPRSQMSWGGSWGLDAGRAMMRKNEFVKKTMAAVVVRPFVDSLCCLHDVTPVVRHGIMPFAAWPCQYLCPADFMSGEQRW